MGYRLNPASRQWPHFKPEGSSSTSYHRAGGHNADMGSPDSKSTESVACLNRSLHVLATVFPRILPEVFREMLLCFTGDSQLQIVVDQLLRHQDKWVKGRWRTVPPESILNIKEGAIAQQNLIVPKDEFRTASYVLAVKGALYQEFNALSKSSIDGVLAEENFCYSRARPALQKLAPKSWKVAIKRLWAAWTKQAVDVKSHYMLDWSKPDKQHGVMGAPILRESGDAELDLELRRTVLEPLEDCFKVQQEMQDRATATGLNEKEAHEAHAIYECGCCFGDTVFEQMATCSTGDHVICFRCVRHASSEALFGQGWGRNVDHAIGEIRCLAATSQKNCQGYLAQTVVQRAILWEKGGREMWKKLEARLAKEALTKAEMPLINCPFCAYAEVDDLYLPQQSVQYRPRINDIKSSILYLTMTLNFLPLLILYVLLCCFLPSFTLPSLHTLCSVSLSRLSRSKHLPLRFQCRSLDCGQPSCLRCFKVWRDPHVCHESATLSLRTTIETARTAALKRTCPQCGLAFVKDSGCNKLTCVCGYTLCYVCRQGLGKGDGGEGYRHFCQHFRPRGGACAECDKCDLYKNLDDDAYIKEAGEQAEREWREREGLVGVAGLVGGKEEAKKKWPQFGWNLQDMMDCWIAMMITC